MNADPDLKKVKAVHKKWGTTLPTVLQNMVVLEASYWPVEIIYIYALVCFFSSVNCSEIFS
jgi:hypothetical protein